MEITLLNDFTLKRRPTIEKLNFKKVNWISFDLKATNELSKIHIPNDTVLSKTEIDNKIIEINTAIKNIIDHTIPTIKIATPDSITIPDALEKINKLKK